MTLTDFEIAVLTALGLSLVFGLALWGQRRRPVDTVPLVHATPALGEIIDSRMALRLAPFEERQKKTEHDVANIRTAMQALPTKDAMHRLEVDVTKLAGRLEMVDGTLTATARSVDRIEQHLIAEKDDGDLRLMLGRLEGLLAAQTQGSKGS